MCIRADIYTRKAMVACSIIEEVTTTLSAITLSTISLFAPITQLDPILVRPRKVTPRFNQCIITNFNFRINIRCFAGLTKVTPLTIC